jgi:hypothetical protein
MRATKAKTAKASDHNPDPVRVPANDLMPSGGRSSQIIALRPGIGREADGDTARQGHPGGDTTGANRSNRAKVTAYLDWLAKTKTPLRLGRVSMTEAAREAGIDTYALLRRRSKLRQLVEAAAADLDVEVRLQRPKDAKLRLAGLAEAAVARRRNDNNAQGIPTEQDVRELRRLCHEVARFGTDGMRTLAANSIISRPAWSKSKRPEVCLRILPVLSRLPMPAPA